MFISNTASDGGYTIANSLRLRESATASLSRTPSSSSNRTTWTWSGWVKLGNLSGGTSGYQRLFSAGSQTEVYLFNNQLALAADSATTSVRTSAVYRDPSAWYHFVAAFDTNNATATDRMRLYINGQRCTAFANNVSPSLGYSGDINSTNAHALGRRPGFNDSYLDGYLSEVNFIDGQALDPSYFGVTNSDGVWTPKAYTGAYGTNGFYLKFNDGSNLTNLCLDRSGNGNNWTATNVSLTAGATYDWMVDTPTNNYGVVSPLAIGADATISNANLSVSYGTSATVGTTVGSFGMPSGKWYWEVTVTASSLAAGTMFIGVVNVSNPTQAGAQPGINANGWSYYGNLAIKKNNDTNTAYGATFGTVGDVIGVALDADSGTLEFFKNGTSQGVAFTGMPITSPFFAAFGDGSVGNTFTLACNFGQQPYTYTNAGVNRPASTFKALCTSNLPAVGITNGRKHFDVALRSGTSGSVAISGFQFRPDLIWPKARNAAFNNYLYDSVRGVGKELISNSVVAESTQARTLLSFDSTGYTLGDDGDSRGVNMTGHLYVDWLWKAGGAGVTNNAGSITSTVSANTAAGFSIVTYTGTGANATVGHGLGDVPKLVIVKRRNSTGEWLTYAAAIGATNFLELNTTAASTSSITAWNNTAPTSSVFSIGTASGANASGGTYLALCFAEVSGYSRIGSYQGNGSADGPFVFCGFRPRFVLVKSSSVGGAGYNWVLYDTARSMENPTDDYLFPNLSDAENLNSVAIDVTANGFKIRTTGLAWNSSGGTYIYMALAENPFGGSNVAPVPAR